MSYLMGNNGYCNYCKQNVCDCPERTFLFYIQGEEFQRKKKLARELASNKDVAYELLVHYLLECGEKYVSMVQQEFKEK